MEYLFGNSYRNWFYKFRFIFNVIMVTYVILHASKIYDQEEIVSATDQEQANITALVNIYVVGDFQPSCQGESQQIRFSLLELVADPKNLLANTAETITALKDLGVAMEEEVRAQNECSEITPTYIYLGQFIEHDTSIC